ncbi:hypothetical protein HBB16_00430 [Pseudonocardia sp. MCCB 268]|nr:hypothetical protein [Pseudonocardia cytotoxica]
MDRHTDGIRLIGLPGPSHRGAVHLGPPGGRVTAGDPVRTALREAFADVNTPT